MESTMESTYVRELAYVQQSPSSSRLHRQDFSYEQRSTLAHRVAQTLVKIGYLSAKDFHCTSDGHTVHLVGTVPSFYVKAMAQTIASKVPDVRRVVNQLQVVRDE